MRHRQLSVWQHPQLRFAGVLQGLSLAFCLSAKSLASQDKKNLIFVVKEAEVQSYDVLGVRTASQLRIIRHLINNPPGIWFVMLIWGVVAFTGLLLNTPVKAQTDLSFTGDIFNINNLTFAEVLNRHR